MHAYATPPVRSWPQPLTEQPFGLYRLVVDGGEVPVWSARVREAIHAPEGAGWAHMFNGRTDWAGFARFDMGGPVEVCVTVDRPFASAAVLPRSAGIQPAVDGQTLRFLLETPRALTLVLDGRDCEPLHLFAHALETDAPDPDDAEVIYFGPGEHWVDTIPVRSGQTVYLDGGAIVRGTLPAGARGVRGGVLNLYSYPPPVLDVRGVEDVRICGRGILDGTAMPHPARNLIRLQNAKRVRVEGITLRNSPSWHLPIVDCDDVAVDGLCCISGRLNSDGINCVSSRNVTVRDCFVRGHDDSFATKATVPGSPCHGIRYERCVAWNDWGFAFGVTYETRAPIHDVTYRDCDAIFARNWPLGIHATDSAPVEDIVFENMGVEFPQTDIDPRMGRALLRIDNTKDVWARDDGIGHVRRIAIRNVTVHGVDIPGTTIHGNDAAHPIEDVAIRNLSINGETVTAETLPGLDLGEHVVNCRVEA